MMTSLWRALMACLAAFTLAYSASAQAGGCNVDFVNAAYSANVDPDTARMNCDIERATTIRERARQLYATQFDPLVEIIDTASPSGAAYIYNVINEGTHLRLEARSVPDGRGPRCRLQAPIADDTANALTILLSRAFEADVPDYGPREEVTINPDGSRSVKLVIDSHDIITRAETPAGVRNFSRHAGSDDLVNQINSLVIGVANVSPDWVCGIS